METRPDESSGRMNRQNGLLPFKIADDVRVTLLGRRTGTKEDIVEAKCNACGYDRARRYNDYGADRVETVICNACGHIHGAEYAYKP